MIPNEPAQRERLVEFVERELIAAWYVVHPARADHAVTEIGRVKFREMAIRAIDLIDGYSEKTPVPTLPKNGSSQFFDYSPKELPVEFVKGRRAEVRDEEVQTEGMGLWT